LGLTGSEEYNSRGIVKSIMGDYTGAMDDYNQALKINDANGNAYFNRALILYEQKQYLPALKDFDMAIQIKPDAEIYNRRANAKCRLNDLRGAFDDYSSAIKMDSAYCVAYLNRGLLKYALKDYKSAIDDYNVCIKLQPDYSLAYYNRGLAKNKLDDWQGEIIDYTSAIEFKPDFEAAYNKRGLAKYEIGDKKGGCQDISRAVELGSDMAYGDLVQYCK
jgi:tetratricopeptide (TPR) repeat protein